jgi:ABC-type polysaccharide/polyol phosphate export permease
MRTAIVVILAALFAGLVLSVVMTRYLALAAVVLVVIAVLLLALPVIWSHLAG